MRMPAFQDHKTFMIPQSHSTAMVANRQQKAPIKGRNIPGGRNKRTVISTPPQVPTSRRLKNRIITPQGPRKTQKAQGIGLRAFKATKETVYTIKSKFCQHNGVVIVPFQGLFRQYILSAIFTIN